MTDSNLIDLHNPHETGLSVHQSIHLLTLYLPLFSHEWTSLSQVNGVFCPIILSRVDQPFASEWCLLSTDVFVATVDIIPSYMFWGKNTNSYCIIQIIGLVSNTDNTDLRNLLACACD